ncbi:tRNA (guanosine(18)-2'-O)-methyltransferase [Desulfonema limicola]|uniref:Putative tRNA (cytidine(34)-2'-O)-methyltransferase n=1 Tax=Desulfonema limicola TaxID=45656 RepID=A0A975B532_9BACT|nr:tRNA (cytidine(34)-2'-O)-methyltransferase [Desulfonema limicola]QTA78934.1 tRNA (guanosine(18)-2'-O)-methyltransferase [Desulfonema limicola]
MTDTEKNIENTYERHVVLVCPQVHWNTGNIGRTCLGTGARLHLIKPLGFSLDSQQVKRAGLDYWQKVNLSVWDDFYSFTQAMNPLEKEIAVFAKKGAKPFWSKIWTDRSFLIFGSETKGLPESILSRYKNEVFHIPVLQNIRCLNLSTAVGIGLYESLRHLPPFHAWS